MLDFSNFLDLPMICLCILVISIFLYVLLDGFDLGVGILLPFAPTEECRDTMINSISPFWDANETWFVLSGGILFIAFPLAYSIVIPALYLPIVLMLIGLVFRGIAIEFRAKASEQRKKIWNNIFHFGSLSVAFFQGIIVGKIIQGFEVKERVFIGDSLSWLNAFSITTGITLIFGYILLGATWLILKTENHTQAWARKCALYSMVYVPILMGIVSIWIPFIDEDTFNTWFKFPNFVYLIPVPISTLVVVYLLYKSIIGKKELSPFILAITLFCLGFIGFGISLWPWAVPRKLTIWETAAAPQSLSLMLVGVILILPVILGYTAYSYYVFRGKSQKEKMY